MIVKIYILLFSTILFGSCALFIEYTPKQVKKTFNYEQKGALSGIYGKKQGDSKQYDNYTIFYKDGTFISDIIGYSNKYVQAFTLNGTHSQEIYKDAQTNFFNQYDHFEKGFNGYSGHTNYYSTWW